MPFVPPSVSARSMAPAPMPGRPSARPQPAPSQSYLDASFKSRMMTARTMLDTRKTSDGRWWGDVHIYELFAMDREGSFARAVIATLGAVNEKQKRMRLREVLAPERAAELFSKLDAGAL